jgi:hypothetical protein
MTKPVLEWLDQLPTEYRDRAKANVKGFQRDIIISAIHAGDALSQAFGWSDTPEGLAFWNRVQREFIADFQPTPKLNTRN